MSLVVAGRGRSSHGVVAVILFAVLAVFPPTARADGPGSGPPAIVSLGDSYISGEGGRWAGNSSTGWMHVDALGSTAYYDNASNTAETQPGCHRSKSAEIWIAGGVPGINLACSGATTSTMMYQMGPLVNYARSHNVRLIMLSVGGNNFNFSTIVQRCVADFLLGTPLPVPGSPVLPIPRYCSDSWADYDLQSYVSPANIATQAGAIANIIQMIHAGMTYAGYLDSAYKVVVQDYMSPLPTSAQIRYGEAGLTRQRTGGCGFWNRDADWANSTVLPAVNQAVRSAVSQAGAIAPNVRLLELQNAFNGRRLCEKGVSLWEETSQNTNPDKLEWINQIRTVSTVFAPYNVIESLHPNYWGQQALQACVRQVWNGGAPRGGTCTLTGPGRNAYGEPLMALG